jgi:steroid 5-alpha reductase family enzyme
MDPILSIFFICSSIIAVFCWVATLITNNYSQIDRLWSILPMFYSWCFVFTSYMHNNNNKQQQQNIIDERTTLMSCLITLWGIRLTYNYWRKGGYKKGEEDYRWTHVKKMFYYPEIKIIFHLFNFVFIAFIQNWLLLSLALPLWTVQTNAKEKMLNIYDLVLAGFFFIFFLIEVVADEQQWHFQQNKKKWLKSNDNKLKFSSNEINDFKQGFLTQGLFRYIIIIIIFNYIILIIINKKDIQDIPIFLVNYQCGGLFICLH